MSYLLIWGAGGHGKVVLDVARSRYRDVALVDDSPSAPTSLFGCKVFPTLDRLIQDRGLPSAFVIAIGNNKARAACFHLAVAAGITPALLVHGSAVVSQFAFIEAGSVVMPNAVINAAATVGANCIVNTSAVVEHDCRVGDHVHLSPGAAAGGGAVIDDFVHVGMGAILLPKSHIGRGSVVGAGGVVLRAVAEQLTVAGVPARAIHARQQ